MSVLEFHPDTTWNIPKQLSLLFITRRTRKRSHSPNNKTSVSSCCTHKRWSGAGSSFLFSSSGRQIFWNSNFAVLHEVSWLFTQTVIRHKCCQGGERIEEQLRERSSWASADVIAGRRVGAKSSRRLMSPLVLVHGCTSLCCAGNPGRESNETLALAFINDRIPSVIKVTLPR